MTTLGERIKAVRKENKLTQLEFSQKIRVSRPFISRIENGKDNPSAPLILLISLLFNVSEVWIFTGKED